MTDKISTLDLIHLWLQDNKKRFGINGYVHTNCGRNDHIKFNFDVKNRNHNCIIIIPSSLEILIYGNYIKYERYPIHASDMLKWLERKIKEGLLYRIHFWLKDNAKSLNIESANAWTSDRVSFTIKGNVASGGLGSIALEDDNVVIDGYFLRDMRYSVWDYNELSHPLHSPQLFKWLKKRLTPR